MEIDILQNKGRNGAKPVTTEALEFQKLSIPELALSLAGQF
ncbi:MAG TPA: hypothetical protein VNY30_06350 [Bryobacteraceae bacterium]|nr:hypothetical protein [Bryobacteraceae bacterium]